MQTIKQDFDPAIPVEKLTEHPDNPRRGDTKAVAESINNNGFYGAILVQRSTGRVLAGHTRLRVAREQGATSVPGIWVDVDDQTARRILLADNRTSDLAFYDDAALYRALQAVLEDDGGLSGTGYDDDTYKMFVESPDGDGSFVGNVRQGPTPEDRAAAYEASDIRSIILPYSITEYERIIHKLTELRRSTGLDTNAAVIAYLIDDAEVE